MPNITITIPTPVLTGSDYFKTRYRQLPNGAFTAYSNKTNAPFTIVGISSGQYELEVIMVKDGVECPAVLKPFTIPPEYTCVTFTPVIVQSGKVFNLQISYPAHANPACGWHIHLIGNQNNKIVNYASLPASPLLIPVANEAFQLKVIADLCNGYSQTCLDTDVPAITPSCTPIEITSTSMVVNNVYPNGFYGMSLQVNFNQSSPPSQYLTVVLTQTQVNSGVPGQTSYLNFTFGPLPTTSTSFSIPIVANSNVTAGLYHFTYLIVDGCNQTHTGTVTKQL